jgi:hypothetical protein
MQDRLTYDAENSVWTLSNAGVHIQSHSDILRVRLELTRLLRRTGRCADLFISLDGFILEPAMAIEYGKLMRRFVDHWQLEVFRYGGTRATATAMRVATLSNAMPPRMFATRGDALSALAHHRLGLRRAGT